VVDVAVIGTDDGRRRRLITATETDSRLDVVAEGIDAVVAAGPDAATPSVGVLDLVGRRDRAARIAAARSRTPTAAVVVVVDRADDVVAAIRSGAHAGVEVAAIDELAAVVVAVDAGRAHASPAVVAALIDAVRSTGAGVTPSAHQQLLAHLSAGGTVRNAAEALGVPHAEVAALLDDLRREWAVDSVAELVLVAAAKGSPGE